MYFAQDGAMHGWNGRDGYVPAAPVTRILCDTCAITEVPLEPLGYQPTPGVIHYHQVKPWKWAPWYGGTQTCDTCDKRV